jgi:hypothetical protein
MHADNVRSHRTLDPCTESKQVIRPHNRYRWNDALFAAGLFCMIRSCFLSPCFHFVRRLSQHDTAPRVHFSPSLSMAVGSTVPYRASALSNTLLSLSLSLSLSLALPLTVSSLIANQIVEHALRMLLGEVLVRRLPHPVLQITATCSTYSTSNVPVQPHRLECS